MNEQFPADPVLIARGKYSTVAAERRALMKHLRDTCESISSCAGRVLRAPDDVDFMSEQATTLATLSERALGAVRQLKGLASHLDELRPVAWGGKAEHEQ